jgi:4-hydroxythreonine-4-phosphate dehydrogenase
LIPADSISNYLDKKTLFISCYHDQGLIPFKILNDNKGINMTLGLKYRRLSPAHGTARDIKFKNKANINSYIECMKI